MINSFRGKYNFLSNFSSSFIIVSGVEYPTVEHAYQACKTLDGDRRKAIAKLGTPALAKKAGQSLDLIGDWEDAKIVIMYDLLKRKFCDWRLGERLRATGNEMIIEGNTWHDNFWGVCACHTCRDVDGENMLGQILMIVRDEL